jgi:hypothetical protein
MRERSTTTGAFDTVFTRLNQQRPSCTGAYSTTSSTLTYGGVQTTKTIVDTETPGFYSLLRCGAFLPLNEVTISTVTETRRAGTGDSHSNKVGGCFRNKSTGPTHATSDMPPLEDPDTSLMDQVATSSLADAKSGVLDGLTTLAELHETADLIKKNWIRIAKFISWFRSMSRLLYRRNLYAIRRDIKESIRRYRAKKKTARDLASLWLEYRYGVMPNVYAIQDAIKSFEKRYAVGTIHKGKSSVTTSLNNATTGSLVLDANRTINYSDIWTGTRTYRGSAYVRITSSAKRVQFDPIITAWELTKFSFLIDWAVDVSSWLKAWSPFSGVEVLGSMVSIKDNYTWRHSYTIDYHLAQSGLFTNTDATQRDVKTYSRVRHGAGILPSFNLRLNLKRFTDLAALIVVGTRAAGRITN